MTLQRLIGTDEAGYGPNLGPLVIGCSCWEVASERDANLDLYQRLAPLVTNTGKPSTSTPSTGNHIQIADSKQVYRSGNLERLERNVLAIIGSMEGGIPNDGFELLRRLIPESDWKALINTFWLTPFLSIDRDELDPIPFPIVAKRHEIGGLAAEFKKQCETAGVRLSKIQCRLILPTAFNQLMSGWGNKADLLSHCTIGLVQGVLENNPALAVDIQCDKHGGRNHYAGLIQHFFGDGLVVVESETREVSRYRFRMDESPATITFLARGESFLPIALSSMVAKYLREFLMKLWNRYWQFHRSGIKPTQGYPVDARRFLSDIQEVLDAMNVPLDTIWRRK